MLSSGVVLIPMESGDPSRLRPGFFALDCEPRNPPCPSVSSAGEFRRREGCPGCPQASASSTISGDTAGNSDDGARCMENAQVALDSTSNIPIVKVAGEIDIATVPLLVEHLDSIPAGVPQVIIDFSELTFIDSSGLNALVAFQKRLDDGANPCTVHLVASRPSILKVLEVTGLDEVFPTSATIEQAAKSA